MDEGLMLGRVLNVAEDGDVNIVWMHPVVEGQIYGAWENDSDPKSDDGLYYDYVSDDNIIGCFDDLVDDHMPEEVKNWLRLRAARE